MKWRCLSCTNCPCESGDGNWAFCPDGLFKSAYRQLLLFVWMLTLEAVSGGTLSTTLRVQCCHANKMFCVATETSSET
jgi:hypothetical protein